MGQSTCRGEQGSPGTKCHDGREQGGRAVLSGRTGKPCLNWALGSAGTEGQRARQGEAAVESELGLCTGGCVSGPGESTGECPGEAGATAWAAWQGALLSRWGSSRPEIMLRAGLAQWYRASGGP